MRIRRTILLLALVSWFGAPAAWAQTRGGDVAVGYSVVSILSNSSTGSESTTLPLGWLFSIASPIGARAALVGELGGHYKTQSVLGTDVSSNLHSFTGGVRFLGSRGQTTPFGQVLIGGARASSGVSGIGSVSTTGLALIPGAGVDIALSDVVALRAQGDVAVFRADGVSDRAFRVAFSAVFGFGH